MAARECRGGFLSRSDDRWRHSLTRREALLSLAGMLAGSPLLRAQLDPRPLNAHRRVPGIDEMMTAFDFEPICFANMPLANYDYMAHGSDSEFTLRRNREAFDWVELVERPGTSPDAVNPATEILGIRMEYPIFVAPSTRQRDLHPDGDAGMYQGATATGTPMILASGSSIPIQKVATSATGPRWSQFYPIQNLTAARDQIELFQANGARAIVVTVDQQTSRYERDLHDRYLGGSTTPRRVEGAEPFAASTRGAAKYRVDPRRMWYSWKYLDDIRPFVKGPMLIKGIINPEDAKVCVERGYDGIIVSNHGGRAMDYVPSTLEVLPEIVDAVGGKIPVLVDSGFRRGADIVKAIALGANAVCLGRAPRWGLGAFGPAGVQRLLEILHAEVRDAMARTGRATLAALDRTAVRTNFPWA
jgi:isopentenyl diphosphate isomerase/L-lactate dehydrogenase-like FMN-dependent dehydrogenase